MAGFVAAVADNRPPLSSAALAYDVVATIYGAYLAAAEGRCVDLVESSLLRTGLAGA